MSPNASRKRAPIPSQSASCYVPNIAVAIDSGPSLLDITLLLSLYLFLQSLRLGSCSLVPLSLSFQKLTLSFLPVPLPVSPSRVGLVERFTIVSDVPFLLAVIAEHAVFTEMPTTELAEK